MRNVSIESWSSESEAIPDAIRILDFLSIYCRFGCPTHAASLSLRLGWDSENLEWFVSPGELNRFHLDLHIVSKPAIRFLPVHRPFQLLAARRRLDIGAESRAAQSPALSLVHRLPSIIGPSHVKKPIVQNPQRASRIHLLNRPLAAINLHVPPALLLALRLAIPLIHRIDAVKHFSVYRRPQQLQILRMRPHQRHRRSRRLSLLQTPLRPVGLVPHLLRQQLPATCDTPHTS